MLKGLPSAGIEPVFGGDQIFAGGVADEFCGPGDLRGSIPLCRQAGDLGLCLQILTLKARERGAGLGPIQFHKRCTCGDLRPVGDQKAGESAAAVAGKSQGYGGHGDASLRDDRARDRCLQQPKGEHEAKTEKCRKPKRERRAGGEGACREGGHPATSRWGRAGARPAVRRTTSRGPKARPRPPSRISRRSHSRRAEGRCANVTTMPPEARIARSAAFSASDPGWSRWALASSRISRTGSP